MADAAEDTGGDSVVIADTPAVRKKIKTAINKVKKLREERAAINADITAIKNDLKANGVNPKAFDLAVKVTELDQEQRDNMDAAYIICRRSIDLPMQTDLFGKK